MKRNLDNRVEVLIPFENGLTGQLRAVLEAHTTDQRSTWDMRPDGSYVQRQPENEHDARDSQATLIGLAEDQLRKATRLRKRKTRTIKSRNLR